MRGIGITVLMLGLLAIIGALAMDVSVSTGTGRVNNIGLIAEQQNYITIGGLMLLLGAVLTVAGRRREVVIENGKDCRACPMCAETIKFAALKCKHCGSDVSGSVPPVQAGQPTTDTEDDAGTQIWIARGVILVIFVGIIGFSLLKQG